MGKIHLRVVGGGNPDRGAGFPAGTHALCGRPLDYGWDIDGEVTAVSVAEHLEPRASDGHVWLCHACADASLPQLNGREAIGGTLRALDMSSRR